MFILFPKRKGIKIATRIIFEEMDYNLSADFIRGMIYFAARFGAITQSEQLALLEYVSEYQKEGELF